MGFFSEVKKMTAAVSGCRVTLFSRYCYAEGVKKVLLFTRERVDVLTAEGRLSILGSGLFIKKYGEGDLLVSGAISAVERA